MSSASSSYSVFDRFFSAPRGYIYSRKMNYMIMIFHGLNTPFESVRHYTDSAKTSMLFDRIFFFIYGPYFETCISPWTLPSILHDEQIASKETNSPQYNCKTNWFFEAGFLLLLFRRGLKGDSQI